MEKILFILLTFCALEVDAQRTNSSVQWSATDQLVWSDFKGNPNRGAHSDALTHVTMGYEFDVLGFNHFLFKLNMSFQRKESWVKKDHRTSYLLAHEQLHFDIHEIFARKFMQYAHEEKVFATEHFSKELKKVFNKTFRELKKMQEAYDRETNHGRNREAQAQWVKKVAKLLVRSEAWSQRTFEFEVD